MKRKIRLWPLVMLTSVGMALFVALWAPLYGWHFELSDFSAGPFLSRAAIYLLPCFVGLWVLVGLFKLAIAFLKWSCRWKNFRWLLLAFGIFLLLIQLFYAEENWRSRRAWDHFRHEPEVNGEKFDFAAFVPASVPDELNFALAPVVVSCYAHCLSTNGHQFHPPNTNIVDHLFLNLYRTNELKIPELAQRWQIGRFIDLGAWQYYFRATSITNHYPEGIPLRYGRMRPLASVGDQLDDTNEVVEIELLATNEFPVAAQPQSPAADVLLALSKFSLALEDLRLAEQQPLSRFPLDYSHRPSWEILLPHLAPLKSIAQVLQLRTVAELASDQSANVINDLKLLFAVARSIQNEPFETDQKVRLGIIDDALDPVWEGLMKHQWTEPQLVELQAALSRLDFLADYQFTVEATRTVWMNDVDFLEQSRTLAQFRKELYFGYDDSGCGLGERTVSFVSFYAYPKGWFQFNQLAIARILQSALPSENEVNRRILSPSVASRFADSYAREVGRPTARNFAAGILVADMGKLAESFALLQASTDMANVACALERYRLANGAFPESLGSLTPRFIGKIPNDVINGQPLHYRRVPAGKFLLYSIGWNGNDDGGVPGVTSHGAFEATKGDWVWTSPPD